MPSGLSGDISFGASDQYEALLAALDAQGARVVLEVEPGFAPAGQLAGVVMAAYGQHACLVGFGINVTHSCVAAPSATARLSDSAAAYVVALVQAQYQTARLYLRAASANVLPQTARNGILFIDDQSGFPTRGEAIAAMQTWATTFSAGQVSFPVGAAADAAWWCQSSDVYAAATLVSALMQAPPANLAGIYWSANSLGQMFPT